MKRNFTVSTNLIENSKVDCDLKLRICTESLTWVLSILLVSNTSERF